MKRWAWILVLAFAVALFAAQGVWAETTPDESDKDYLQSAIDSAVDNGTVTITKNLTLNETITVNKRVTITALENVKIKVSDGANIFRLYDGAKLYGLDIEKTDNVNQDIVQVFSGAIVENCKFKGRYTPGDNQVTRAMEVVSGASDYVIRGNTISNLRQPAYINGGGKGEVSNNTVDGTRGWVVCNDANAEFTDNEFGTNAVDIAIIIQGDPAINNYKQIAQSSDKNNGAHVQNQLSRASAEDGHYIVTSGEYATLKGALGDAGSGDTIVLEEEVTLSENLTIPNGVTLDLNGHSITGNGNITITNDATVTLINTDSSKEGSVTIGNKTYTPTAQPTVLVNTGDEIKIKYKITVVNCTASGLDNDGYALEGTEIELTANPGNFIGWTAPDWAELKEDERSSSTITITVIDNGTFTANFYVAPPVPPALTVTPSSLTLKPGETGQLTASEAGATWTSSDEKVATVNESGLVTAVAEGAATVTATAGGRTATCAVTVGAAGTDPDPDPAEEFDIGIKVLAVKKGKELILPVMKGYKGTWSVVDGSVARISKNGKRVKALKVGETELTYKVEEVVNKKSAVVLNDRKLKAGEVYTIEFNVRKAAELPTGIALDEKKLTLDLAQNKAVKLTATVKPAKALDKQVFWTSNKPGVAAVDQEGNVTAVSPGTCKITAVTANLKRKAITVKVLGEVTKVTVSPKKQTLKVGETFELTAKVNEDALDKTVTWKSSNPEVASVDENGLVTAVKKGKATITATVGGKKAKCVITVKK